MKTLHGCGSWGSWSIATKKVICCRSSRSRWKTARHFFTKSYSARAQRALAPETSRRCSRRSSANRTFAETSSHADLSHTRTNPSQEAYRLQKTRWRDLRRGAGRSRRISRNFLASLSHPSTDDRQVRSPAARDEIRSRWRPDPSPSPLSDIARQKRRQRDARPTTAPVQPGHRDALRRARRERRALLSQRPGGRARLHQQGQRNPRDFVRSAAVLG